MHKNPLYAVMLDNNLSDMILTTKHDVCASNVGRTPNEPRRAAPRLEQRSKQSLLCAADRRRMAPPVCVHTLKTMCSNLKDMARRGAAHPVCEPLKAFRKS